MTLTWTITLASEAEHTYVREAVLLGYIRQSISPPASEFNSFGCSWIIGTKYRNSEIQLHASSRAFSSWTGETGQILAKILIPLLLCTQTTFLSSPPLNLNMSIVSVQSWKKKNAQEIKHFWWIKHRSWNRGPNRVLTRSLRAQRVQLCDSSFNLHPERNSEGTAYDLKHPIPSGKHGECTVMA